MKLKTTHLTFVTHGRQPIAPDEAGRRALVRVIIERAGRSLVCFCVVDEHVHVVFLSAPERTGILARALLFGIRGAASVPVHPAHVQPVVRRTHAEWLVTYVLTQTDHHGLREHAALWSGSCFADLVGARCVDGWVTSTIAAALPRWRMRSAYSAVGLPTVELEPMDLASVRGAGAARVVAAVASALAVGPELSGNAAGTALARRAAAKLAAEAGIQAGEVAEVLGLTVDSATRAAGRPVEERVLRAARIRLSLEDAVARLSAR